MAHNTENAKWYEKISSKYEDNTLKFTIWATIAVVVGGLIEIPPFFLMASLNTPKNVTPYSALELAGRDAYQQEGCFYCHTQMIRPFKWETDRWDRNHDYGSEPYSKAGEYVYDHPFLWGSKRTGPDLSHEASLNNNPSWQKQHLMDPRSTSPGSIMPAFPHLFKDEVDPAQVKAEMKGLRMIGVPYTDDQIAQADQLKGVTKGDALIAYLLKLGRDEMKK